MFFFVFSIYVAHIILIKSSSIIQFLKKVRFSYITFCMFSPWLTSVFLGEKGFRQSYISLFSSYIPIISSDIPIFSIFSHQYSDVFNLFTNIPMFSIFSLIFRYFSMFSTVFLNFRFVYSYFNTTPSHIIFSMLNYCKSTTLLKRNRHSMIKTKVLTKQYSPLSDVFMIRFIQMITEWVSRFAFFFRSPRRLGNDQEEVRRKREEEERDKVR